jgi:hypothetical protein
MVDQMPCDKTRNVAVARVRDLKGCIQKEGKQKTANATNGGQVLAQKTEVEAEKGRRETKRDEKVTQLAALPAIVVPSDPLKSVLWWLTLVYDFAYLCAGPMFFSAISSWLLCSRRSADCCWWSHGARHERDEAASREGAASSVGVVTELVLPSSTTGRLELNASGVMFELRQYQRNKSDGALQLDHKDDFVLLLLARCRFHAGGGCVGASP